MDEKSKQIRARAVIDFLTKEGETPLKIHQRMVTVYGEDAPSYATVKRWSALFKHGRETLEDDPRSGRPVEVSTEEMCQKVEHLVMSNRRIRVMQIAEELGLSCVSVWNILREKLGMSKCCALPDAQSEGHLPTSLFPV